MNPTLVFLKSTVETWVDRLQLVSKSFPQKQNSYYLESTLVSLLAGSAWANGLSALTEVKTKRAPMNVPEGTGRLDLLMQDSDRRIALEAKLIWNSELIIDNVMGTLSAACTEVISISGIKAQILLGCVFFVPWWNSKDQKEKLKSMTIDRYVNLKVDLKACYYDQTLDFPGAILLASIARPS
jgi:hypothetical protein